MFFTLPLFLTKNSRTDSSVIPSFPDIAKFLLSSLTHAIIYQTRKPHKLMKFSAMMKLKFQKHDGRSHNNFSRVAKLLARSLIHRKNAIQKIRRNTIRGGEWYLEKRGSRKSYLFPYLYPCRCGRISKSRKRFR